MRLRSATKQRPDPVDSAQITNDNSNGSFQETFFETPAKRSHTRRSTRSESILKIPAIAVDNSPGQENTSPGTEQNNTERPTKKARVRFVSESQLESVKTFSKEDSLVVNQQLTIKLEQLNDVCESIKEGSKLTHEDHNMLDSKQEQDSLMKVSLDSNQCESLFIENETKQSLDDLVTAVENQEEPTPQSIQAPTMSDSNESENNVIEVVEIPYSSQSMDVEGKHMLETVFTNIHNERSKDWTEHLMEDFEPEAKNESETISIDVAKYSEEVSKNSEEVAKDSKKVATMEPKKVETNDPFVNHVELNLTENDFENYKSIAKQTIAVRIGKIGQCKYVYKKLDIENKFKLDREHEFNSSSLKTRLLNNLADISMDPRNKQMPKLTYDLFNVVSNYKDLLYNERTLDNADQIRTAYALHALNHVLKTRAKVIRNNQKLKKMDNANCEFRDQGFTRPKVLIMIPYRSCAFKLVELLIKLFIGSKRSENRESVVKPKSDNAKSSRSAKSNPKSANVAEDEEEDDEEEEEFEIHDELPHTEMEEENPEEEDEDEQETESEADGVKKGKVTIMNFKKFKRAFHSDETKPFKKPEDYKQMFAGNTDEYFRLGIEFTKSSFKLYSKFYSSDIIIASPLGLRTVIGAEGEKRRDFDFLSSIELLILDQAECFLMQNWEHVLHVLQHLNCQPKESHNADFSRLRMWSLDGLAQHYRQTLVFSSISSLYVSSMFERECHNYEGKLVQANLTRSVDAAVSRVYLPIEHRFYRFDSKSLIDSPDARFKFFVDKILPKFNTSQIGHTLIYVPSYFDYLRLRNHMRTQEISFTQICEHTDRAKMALSRKRFFMNKRTFMLYTERAHFYNRYEIKGIRHLIFYQPPTLPHFYSELCNLLHETNQRKDFADDGHVFDCTVLFDRFDVGSLTRLVGAERSQQMMKAFLGITTFRTGARPT